MTFNIPTNIPTCTLIAKPSKSPIMTSKTQSWFHTFHCSARSLWKRFRRAFGNLRSFCCILRLKAPYLLTVLYAIGAKGSDKVSPHMPVTSFLFDVSPGVVKSFKFTFYLPSPSCFWSSPLYLSFWCPMNCCILRLKAPNVSLIMNCFSV